MYKRILLKLSGEALKGKKEDSILDVECVREMANVIKRMTDRGIQVSVVIGAGNIWRGKLASQIGIDQVPADYMGMMGTVINAVALSSSLKTLGVKTIVYSAIPAIPGVNFNYDAEDAKKHLDEGYVTFFAGGIGKPFYTTDTAATTRAIETECEVIFAGKNGVKGVYDKDPRQYADAKFYDVITYKEMLDKKLQIMDLSAIELIKDKNIEIRVFSMEDVDNFEKVALGDTMGTRCIKGE